jgi:hypothetical protein
MNPSDVQPSQTFPEPMQNVALPLGYDPSMYDRGVAAFERELPQLMKTHHRQFVGYRGDRRFGPVNTLRRLDSLFKKEHVPLGERVYRVVEPDTTFDISFGLGAVTFE